MDSSERCSVDGHDSGVSPLDRGLRYGDGVFTTVRVQLGRRWLWADHLERLGAGCARLGMPWSETTRRQLESEAQQLIGTDSGILRVTLTRGLGGQGYRPPAAPEPTRVLTFGPLPSAHAQGAVTVRLCRTRLALVPQLAGIKHLNRLENVLARAEWDAAQIAEGLMTDDEGRLVSATAANLFLRTGRRLETPALERCGVQGVMRRQILERRIPALGELIDLVAETDVRVDDLLAADEVFLTNAVFGVRSLGRLVAADDADTVLGRWPAPGSAVRCIAASIAPFVDPEAA